jgi:hypothetical protein
MEDGEEDFVLVRLGDRKSLDPSSFPKFETTDRLCLALRFDTRSFDTSTSYPLTHYNH